MTRMALGSRTLSTDSWEVPPVAREGSNAAGPDMLPLLLRSREAQCSPGTKSPTPSSGSAPRGRRRRRRRGGREVTCPPVALPAHTAPMKADGRALFWAGENLPSSVHTRSDKFTNLKIVLYGRRSCCFPVSLVWPRESRDANLAGGGAAGQALRTESIRRRTRLPSVLRGRDRRLSSRCGGVSRANAQGAAVLPRCRAAAEVAIRKVGLLCCRRPGALARP